MRYAYRLPAASRRASNAGGASRAASTRTSGGNVALSARRTDAASSALVVVSDATCRSACTPASVRLAPTTFAPSPRIVRAAVVMTPWTVATSGWICQPAYVVPS